MPQAKTLPLQAGFRIPEKFHPGNENENIEDPEKSSVKDKFNQSKLGKFQPWKNNSNDNKRSAAPILEKLSSSSSESGDKAPAVDPLTPVNKRDSISDSEGMSGLKRLLRKETSQNNLAVPGASSEPSNNLFSGIKKSPSAGSTSYWSRVSSTQPSFLRKFFPEKSSPTEEAVKPVIAEQPIPEPILPESVLSLNVAQKANMFMKLEHEQRFSKWHNAEHQNRPRSTRFSTQPVTTEEVFSATKALDDLNSNGENVSTIAQSSTIQPSSMSASADVDDKLPSGSALLEPSRLSLKDRVNMFNRMSTIPMAIIQSRPPSSGNKGSFGSNSRLNNCTGTSTASEITNTGGLLSRSLNNDTDSSYDNLNGFMSDKNSNDLRRRRGSDSSIGMSSGSAFKSPVEQQTLSGPGSIPNTPPTAARIPVAAVRNSRVKSLFIPTSSDPDNLSEDGEISSGGQEVAEIISRSYENSPIFRKKSWRTQQPQPSFAKELWRKFAKVDEEGSRQWSGAPTIAQHGFSTQPISSPLFPKLVRSGGGYPITTTSSSNLLPILTALSSSDDQLSEAKASANVPPIKPRRSNIRKILNQKAEMSQSLGKEESGEELTYQTCEIDSIPRNAQQQINTNTEDSAGFSSVKREGDLLIMKKHMPVVRRKSSGKSKNPLKVLAARMDFRNQKYTETLVDSDTEHNARSARDS